MHSSSRPYHFISRVSVASYKAIHLSVQRQPIVARYDARKETVEKRRTALGKLKSQNQRTQQRHAEAGGRRERGGGAAAGEKRKRTHREQRTKEQEEAELKRANEEEDRPRAASCKRE